jgi:hypothetical protein
MKSLVAVLIVLSSVLAGCVVAEPPYRADNHNQGRGDRDRDRDGIPDRADRDRDGDGVRNSQDRRPDNRNRY